MRSLAFLLVLATPALRAQAPILPGTGAPTAMTERAAPRLEETAEPPLAVRTDGRAAEVWLAQGADRRRLDSVPGTLGRTWAYFATLFWADFPGMRAEVRVRDAKPEFLVAMDRTPRNRIFLVACRTNRGDRNRSVKMGQAGVFTYKGLQAPDMDWVVETEVREEKPGLWRIVPRAPLKPGEYGLFSGAAGAQETKGSPAGELWEFGVDPRG